ncbi:MAG: hypothetical protein M3Z25_10055 [Actinomycetota bacterium]|nr:hypothetical protein [Actinomycetota bacterium]
MMSLDLRHDSAAVEPASPRSLAELAGDLKCGWPELSRPLVLRWSDAPVLTLDRGRPWLYSPIERDPLARGGRTVVPRAQLRQLDKLAARHLPIQRLAVAHELDPVGPARDLVPLLRNGSRTCTDDVARQLVGPLPAHPGVARAARLVDAVVGGAGRAAAGGFGSLRDPVVFGVIAPTRPLHGEPCLWFLLAAWIW